MARRDLKLTFHAASKRWCKYHHGKRFYYGSGSSKSDTESYKAALALYEDHMASYAAAAEESTKALYHRVAIELDNNYGVPASIPVPSPSGVTAEGKTIEQVSKAYVKYQEQRLVEGAISEARLTSIGNSIKRLTKSIGDVKISKSDDGSIEKALDQYRAYLFGNGYKMATITDSLQVCSALMVWAYERRHLNHLPRNLKSATKGKQREKNPNPLTVKQIKKLLAGARPDFRCYCLLALNCGLYPADIGALTPSNIKGGYLRYARAKTDQMGLYRLWDETAKAIEAVKGEGEYLFSTRKGKRVNKNSLRQAFDDFNYEGKTFSSLRDTSATLIDAWARQGEFVNNVKQQFLAHKDSSVAAHYTGNIEDVDPSQIKTSELDKAIRMLEDTYLTK